MLFERYWAKENEYKVKNPALGNNYATGKKRLLMKDNTNITPPGWKTYGEKLKIN